MTLRAYGIIVAAFFTVFIAYAIRYGYGLLLPRMLPALGITKTQAGVIYAVYFVAYTIFSPLLGFLSDRFDVRRILTAFTALLALGAFLMASAATVGQAALFFTLAGIGAVKTPDSVGVCLKPDPLSFDRVGNDRVGGSADHIREPRELPGIQVHTIDIVDPFEAVGREIQPFAIF